MAQTGFTPIQLYSSSTATNVPLAANLATGELAINITDGKLFYKDNSAAVQVIGWKTTPTSAGGTGLTSYAAGDMVYYASGTTLTKLAIGATDYVMTSSGSSPQWSASLKAIAGGTGQTSYAVGDLLYANTTTTLAKLADVATGNALISGGVGVAPSWGKIGLTTHVSGVLPLANGGTNNATGAATAVTSNATSGVMQITGPAAASTRVMTIPDASFTAARTDAAQTFSGQQTFETASDNQVNIDATGSGAYSTINFKQGGSSKANMFADHAAARFYVINISGGVYLASGGIAWIAVSDERKKDIIEPITNATNKVNQLRTVIGKYKTDAEGTRRSFLIAQDVQAVFPEAVDATNPDVLGLSYSEIIPLLVAAIKEQTQEIEQLKLAIKGN